MLSMARTARVARLCAIGAATALVLTGCGLFGAPAPKARTTLPKTTPATVQGTGATLPSGGAALGGAIAVTVDNEASARPQSGIDRASLVFEAPAEGGITRFLALFWQKSAGQIGPVRSTRIYFDQLAQSYGLPLAHAGGNVDALAAIKPLGIQNIDEIWTVGAAPFFYRSSSRQAPHNLYTSTNLLMRAVHALGLKLGPVPAWPHKALPATQGSAAGTMEIDYSSVETVRWVYQNGAYVRYEASQPDNTLNGRPVRANAVVVLYVGVKSDPDPYTPGSIKLLMTGSGKGQLAADGRVVPVTWQRQAGKPFTILGQNGAAQAMPAAPLWIELVPTGTPVHITP